MIERLYNITLSVSRMVWTETAGISKSELGTVGNINGHLQQASREYAQSLGYTTTKPYTLWCDIESDIKEGDILADSSYRYAVKGVQRNTNGKNRHLEAIIEWLGESVANI